MTKQIRSKQFHRPKLNIQATETYQIIAYVTKTLKLTFNKTCPLNNNGKSKIVLAFIFCSCSLDSWNSRAWRWTEAVFMVTGVSPGSSRSSVISSGMRVMLGGNLEGLFEGTS
jgi:hypothetical protein